MLPTNHARNERACLGLPVYATVTTKLEYCTGAARRMFLSKPLHTKCGMHPDYIGRRMLLSSIKKQPPRTSGAYIQVDSGNVVDCALAPESGAGSVLTEVLALSS